MLQVLINIVIERRMIWTEDNGEDRRGRWGQFLLLAHIKMSYGEKPRGKKRSFTFFTKTVGKIPKGD